jgi:hypothetical protein
MLPELQFTCSNSWVFAVFRIRQYVRVAISAPKAVQTSGEESRCNGTDKLTSRQTDRIVSKTRRSRRKP